MKRIKSLGENNSMTWRIKSKKLWSHCL